MCVFWFYSGHNVAYVVSKINKFNDAFDKQTQFNFFTTVDDCRETDRGRSARLTLH